VIFQIEVIARDNGLYAPLSLIRAGERTFFYSSQGFQVILPGQYPTPIGREKVDRTTLTDIDKANLKYFVGASDPRSTRVFWAYKSVSGPDGMFDKMLCYDWVLDKFTPISVQGEFLFPVTQPGLTLEALDALSGSLDALSGSLDDFITVAKPEIGAVSTSHQIGFFRGGNLEATIESAEQGTDGQAIKIRGFRPVTDATALFGSASSRMTQQATAVAGQEVAISGTTGRCDMIVSTRYSRMKCRIPAGTPWSFFAGVEPDVIQKGKR
jgi:hypothetical protein